MDWNREGTAGLSKNTRGVAVWEKSRVSEGVSPDAYAVGERVEKRAVEREREQAREEEVARGQREREVVVERDQKRSCGKEIQSERVEERVIEIDRVGHSAGEGERG